MKEKRIVNSNYRLEACRADFIIFEVSRLPKKKIITHTPTHTYDVRVSRVEQSTIEKPQDGTATTAILSFWKLFVFVTHAKAHEENFSWYFSPLYSFHKMSPNGMLILTTGTVRIDDSGFLELLVHFSIWINTTEFISFQFIKTNFRVRHTSGKLTYRQSSYDLLSIFSYFFSS